MRVVAQPWLVRSIVSLLAGALVAVVVGSPAGAAGYVKLTLTASPNPPAPGGQVTFTGTATGVGATFHSVVVGFGGLGAISCQPTSICTISNFGQPRFSIPTLGSTPVKFSAVGPTAPGQTVTAAVYSCVPDTCLVTSASVTIKAPTISLGISYAPAGAILPGETLHFTISGATSIGPVTGVDLATDLLRGLGPPTSISQGATWSAAYPDHIDYNTVLDDKVRYTWDAVVTAPLGGSVKVRADATIDGPKLDTQVQKTLILHVGPTPTPKPTPKPTPRPTATPKPKATPSPTPTPVSTPSSTPTPSATPTSGSIPPSPAPSAASSLPSEPPSPGLPGVGAALLSRISTPPSARPQVVTGSPSSSTASLPGVGVLAVTLMVGLGGLTLITRRRRG